MYPNDTWSSYGSVERRLRVVEKILDFMLATSNMIKSYNYDNHAMNSFVSAKPCGKRPALNSMCLTMFYTLSRLLLAFFIVFTNIRGWIQDEMWGRQGFWYLGEWIESMGYQNVGYWVRTLLKILSGLRKTMRLPLKYEIRLQ
ncbi:hypothetical protein F4703DRAFT_1788821 [Phycomyces blakesleeanus]